MWKKWRHPAVLTISGVVILLGLLLARNYQINAHNRVQPRAPTEITAITLLDEDEKKVDQISKLTFNGWLEVKTKSSLTDLTADSLDELNFDLLINDQKIAPKNERDVKVELDTEHQKQVDSEKEEPNTKLQVNSEQTKYQVSLPLQAYQENAEEHPDTEKVYENTIRIPIKISGMEDLKELQLQVDHQQLATGQQIKSERIALKLPETDDNSHEKSQSTESSEHDAESDTTSGSTEDADAMKASEQTSSAATGDSKATKSSDKQKTTVTDDTKQSTSQKKAAAKDANSAKKAGTVKAATQNKQTTKQATKKAIKAAYPEDPESSISKETIETPQIAIRQDQFSQKFQLWSKNGAERGTVEMTDKKTADGNILSSEDLRKNYYSSYHKASDNSQFSQALIYGANNDSNVATLASDVVKIKYNDVGVYSKRGVDTNKLGALVTIKNMQKGNSPGDWLSDNIFLDISNNLYSGLTYGLISQMDIDIKFLDETGTKQVKVTDDEQSYITFGSLNGHIIGNKIEPEWVESVDSLPGILSPNTIINKIDNRYEGSDESFGDNLGSIDFETAAVTFPINGTDHRFKLGSAFGFTWQTFASGSVNPMEQEAPEKTVTESAQPGEQNELDITRPGQGDVKVNGLDSYYYYVYQKTYTLPDESIAKPSEITMTDTLPTGVTLKDNKIKIYDSSPQHTELKAQDGTAKIDTDSDGRTTIRYELSKAQIEELRFNGRAFVFRMNIQHDESDLKSKPITMSNTANVRFKTSEQFNWAKDSNTVTTQLLPKTLDLDLEKVVSNGLNGSVLGKLPNISFDLTDADGKDLQQVKTDEDGKLSFSNLEPGKEYQITERLDLKRHSEQRAINQKATDKPFKFKLANNGTIEIIQPHPNFTVQNGTDLQVKNPITNHDFHVKKVDGETGKVLKGSKFKLAAKGKNDKTYYATFANDTWTGWTENKSDATEITIEDTKKLSSVPSHAFIKVSSLDDLVEIDKYQLIETTAPAGYSKRNFDLSIDDPGTAEKPIELKNYGYSLPVTGGTGIWIFLIAGIGLISGGTYYYFRRRKNTTQF